MLSTIDRLSGRLRGAAVLIAAQVFLLSAGQTADAQTGTGIIRGKVIDPTGAIVVGAEVLLTPATATAASTADTTSAVEHPSSEGSGAPQHAL